MVVAAMFTFGGLSSLVGTLLDFHRGQFHWDFGIVGIAIGLGLVLRRAWWRSAATTTCELAVLVLLFFLFATLALGAQPTIKFFGMRFPDAPTFASISVTVASLFVVLWSWMTLRREDIRVLFSGRQSNDSIQRMAAPTRFARSRTHR